MKNNRRGLSANRPRAVPSRVPAISTIAASVYQMPCASRAELSGISMSPTAAALAYGPKRTAATARSLSMTGARPSNISRIEIGRVDNERQSRCCPTKRRYLPGVKTSTCASINYSPTKFNKESRHRCAQGPSSCHAALLKEAAEKAKIELASIQQTDSQSASASADAAGTQASEHELTPPSASRWSRNLVPKTMSPSVSR